MINRYRCIKIHSSYQYFSTENITILTSEAYQPCSLQGDLLLKQRNLILKLASHLDAFSGYPFQTQLLGNAVIHNNRYTRGSSTPVLSYQEQISSNSYAPIADRGQTVSRRSEPSSRTALNGEQPYPWDLLQPQDATSRHRGAKPRRRCELLDAISLLSLG